LIRSMYPLQQLPTTCAISCIHTHHTHTHSHTHAHTLTHTHTYTCTRMHTLTHTLSHTHKHTHAHTRTHVRVRARTHTHTHTYMHAHAHTRTHMHARARMHAHTYLRTRVCAFALTLQVVVCAYALPNTCSAVYTSLYATLQFASGMSPAFCCVFVLASTILRLSLGLVQHFAVCLLSITIPILPTTPNTRMLPRVKGCSYLARLIRRVRGEF